MKYKKLKRNDQKVPKQAEAKMDDVINPQNYKFSQFKTRKILMLSKRHESTEVGCRTLLYVPSETNWSTSSDTHQVVEIQIETSTKMYTPFLIGLNLRYGPYAHFGY